MNQCKKCKVSDCLVLQVSVADYVCEWCGEWQDAVLNDVYEVVGSNA
jgi:hypothetical protein